MKKKDLFFSGLKTVHLKQLYNPFGVVKPDENLWNAMPVMY